MKQLEQMLEPVQPRATGEEFGFAISAVAYASPPGPTAMEGLFWSFLVLTAPEVAGGVPARRTRWKGTTIVSMLRAGTKRPEDFFGPEREFAEAAAAVLALPESAQAAIRERVRDLIRRGFL